MYLKSNKESLKENKINSYVLDTFGPLTQYTLFIPFLMFYFKEFGFFNKNFFNTYKLMKLHRSQFNLNRKLHVLFSCFSYMNSFTKLELS